MGTSFSFGLLPSLRMDASRLASAGGGPPACSSSDCRCCRHVPSPCLSKEPGAAQPSADSGAAGSSR
eukprot:14493679-Alexandrium_andersonii.AAC.1